MNSHLSGRREWGDGVMAGYGGTNWSRMLRFGLTGLELLNSL